MAAKLSMKIQDYIKYTLDELNTYAQTDGSCVHKINTDMIVIIGPYCLADFKNLLRSHIKHEYVGHYNRSLDSIILDIKNIKLFSDLAAMRADDAFLHIKFNADFYVFKPKANAILTGVVKHIGNKHVGVVVYRVFNVNLKIPFKVNTGTVELEKEVKFRMRTFDLQNIYPYIEGELVTGETNEVTNSAWDNYEVAYKEEEELQIKEERDTSCTDIDTMEVESKQKSKKRKKKQVNGF